MLETNQNDRRARNNPIPAFDITVLSWEETEYYGEIEAEITATLESPCHCEITRVMVYLAYKQEEPHAEILVTAGDKHFCSTSTRDWPVLDVLFGRMAWKNFANDFAYENASAWDPDEE